MKKIFLISLLLSGCVTLEPQPALKLYEGKNVSLSEVASIRGSNLCSSKEVVIGETRIVAVNGVKTSSFSTGYQRDLLVKPGNLSISVYWFYGNLYTKNNVNLVLDAKAGHRYIVRAETDYKEKINFSIEDLGSGSGSKSFEHPIGKNGKPSNCY